MKPVPCQHQKVDAIVHVVEMFEDSNIVHVDKIDPLRDIETINLELIFSDLEILERRSQSGKLSRNDKTAAKELELLNASKSIWKKIRWRRALQQTMRENRK